MSGIVGILNIDGSPVDRSLLARFTEFLTFRGPDAQETWSQGPVGLGHALLQTADDTGADCQPWSQDGEVVITADARIDGRADLRRQLSSHGCHDLEEATDAELILHSYLVWGAGCVKHLLGDFAFAIWDGRRRELFCARDHFGIKPFYYAQVGNSLVFSNTLNCLRLHPRVSGRLNELAIADFLLFDCNMDQFTTTFADIRRLPPAHSLIWQQGGLRLASYWSLPLIDRPLKYSHPQDYVEHFKALLTQAVADRVRTRKVGVALSGGLDSSTVAALAGNLLKRQSAPFDLQGYTTVFDRLIPDEERHYSGLVASALGIPVHVLPADDYRLFERFEDPDFLPPQPVNNPMHIAWIDIVRFAGANSRVMFTGHAGDNLLQTSPSYIHKMAKGLRLIKLATEVGRCLCHYGRFPEMRLRTSLKRWLSFGENPPFYPFWLNPVFEAKAKLRARWQHLTSDPESSGLLREEAYHRLICPYWQHLFENLYDPGTTRIPVDFYHPYFDIRLVTFALALPPLPWCMDKILLRQTGKNLLPQPVLERPKAPWVEDPVPKMIRRSEARGLDKFSPAPPLSDFVNWRAIFPLTSENTSLKLWMNLRPMSLNYFLRAS